MGSWKARRDPVGILIWTHCLCGCRCLRTDRSSCNPSTRLAENLAERPVHVRRCASCLVRPMEVQTDRNRLAGHRKKVLSRNIQLVTGSQCLDLCSLSGLWPSHLLTVSHYRFVSYIPVHVTYGTSSGQVDFECVFSHQAR